MGRDISARLAKRKLMYGRIPRRNADFAARYAVLYPLTGVPTKFTGLSHEQSHEAWYKEVVSKTQTLVKRWQNQVINLAAAGWNALGSDDDIVRMASCYPSFVICETPKVYCCGRDHICPFCYGRVIQKLYGRIAMMAKGAIGEHYQLLGFRAGWVMSGRAHPVSALSKLVDREIAKRGKIYRDLMSHGAYMSTTIEPYGSKHWRVIRRGILLTANTDDVMVVLPRESKAWIVREYNPDVLIRLVGRVLRYPTALMSPRFVYRLVPLLGVREKRRLSASYGLLRNQH